MSRSSLPLYCLKKTCVTAPNEMNSNTSPSKKKTKEMYKWHCSELESISMNHDIVDMFREKLDRFTISDYYGLNSPGITCYLNSVLQVLFMTQDFREAVKRCCSEDSTTIDPHLGRLFADLQKSVAKTHHVTTKLGITNVYEQRDAAEYFEKILCLTSPEAAKMFKGELNHKSTCLKCKERIDSRNFFWILPLVVEDSRHQIYSVEKGLKAFMGEKVCGDNKMFCNRCNKKQDAKFGCEITQNPEVLTLLLKRFSFDYRRRCYVKLHCKVDVPQTLLLEDCKYDLYALVNHCGNLTGGHYTAQIKSFETHGWYQFNDNVVTRVKQPVFGAGEKYLRSCTAYLLMYRKASRNPEKADEGDWKALSAYPDVEAEGRRDNAEKGKGPAPHQLKEESCNGGKNSKHLNGDALRNSHGDTVSKNVPNLSWELEKQPNQRATRVRLHKEMLLQTDTAADGDKPGLQTQKTNSAKLQKDGGQNGHEPNRPEINTNSKVNMWCLNTTEKRPQRVKPAETKVVKNKTEAEVGMEGKKGADVGKNVHHSDVKSSHVFYNGYSSSVQYLTRHPHIQFGTNEPIGRRYSPDLYRKSNRLMRDEKRVVTADSSCKLEATQTVTKVERSASPTKKRNPTKSAHEIKRAPWR